MNKVYDFLLNKIKLNEKDILIVGVSAGPDSMALLYVLKELRKKIGYKIVVAHVNHNVRKESVEEAEFLKEYCNKNNITFEMMTITKYGDDNFHNEARNIRYHFYEELINKYNANYLMTGHHADDLMETILMRIVRGSTMRGYSGFSDIVDMGNYKIVRPLISVTKKELEDFDKENNIPYRIDQSNFKDKYTRNRYRKSVLPFLKEEDNRVHEKFINFSNQIRESDEFIERITFSVIDSVYQDGIIDVNKFRLLDIVIQKRIIDYIFSMIYRDDIIEIDRRHVDLVLEAINSNKASVSFNLPNDYMVVKEYNKVYFKKDIKEVIPYDIELSNEVFLPNGLTIKRVDESKTDGNDILRINNDDVVLPLRVRTRKNGDRIKVKNMNGTKKVNEVLINAKIPLGKRDLWPIVVDSEDKVIWIPKVKKSKYNRRKDEDCDIIFRCF
jgi:tRNA(Ile)-lysidine synthetase-like protein